MSTSSYKLVCLCLAANKMLKEELFPNPIGRKQCTPGIVGFSIMKYTLLHYTMILKNNEISIFISIRLKILILIFYLYLESSSMGQSCWPYISKIFQYFFRFLDYICSQCKLYPKNITILIIFLPYIRFLKLSR